MPDHLPPATLVADTATLQICVKALQQCEALAVDTEFMRTDTFYPILGLIQIYDGHDCWLIDPLAIEDLQPLVAVFTELRIIKVFHSCSEDLEVLQHKLGCIPVPVFDTQIAAALAGYGFSKGYAALVSDMLDIHVPKGETRSDWLQRPLREAQLGYAASDVYHLLPVYEQLMADLDRLDRVDWMAEEMATLAERANLQDDGSDYYRKIKGAWRLSPKELLVLQSLCQWREVEARQCNRPRNRVLDEKTLLDIATKQPSSKAELSNIEGMHPGLIRRYGDILLHLLQTTQDSTASDYLEPLDSPLPKESRNLGKLLKEVVSRRAEELQLPVEMLARKRDIEELVRSVCDGGAPILSASLAAGWRHEVVGTTLLKAVAETQAE